MDFGLSLKSSVSQEKIQPSEEHAAQVFTNAEKKNKNNPPLALSITPTGKEQATERYAMHMAVNLLMGPQSLEPTGTCTLHATTVERCGQSTIRRMEEGRREKSERGEGNRTKQMHTKKSISVLYNNGTEPR